MKRDPRTRCKSAFTLIELLIVIAIIAILVAMLMPTLGRVRYSAKNVVCLNNVKQIGVAMTMYAKENKNYFWPNHDWSLHAWTYFYLDTFDEKYVGSGSTHDVFYCPLHINPRRSQQEMWDWMGGLKPYSRIVSYSLYTSTNTPNFNQYRQVKITKPAPDSPMLSDLCRDLFDEVDDGHPDHAGRRYLNYFFMDGSAEGYPLYSPDATLHSAGQSYNRFYWSMR